MTPRDALDRLAQTLPPPLPLQRTTAVPGRFQNPSNGFDLEAWIGAQHFAIEREKPWEGGTLWILAECPFGPEHHGSAHIKQPAHGGISFGCFHNSCQDKDWAALRDLCEPGWRDRRNGHVHEEGRGFAPAESMPAANVIDVTDPKGNDNDDNRPWLVSLTKLKQQYAAEPTYLVPQYIERGALILLPGPPESLKSWAMVDLMRAVAVGGSWLGHFPVEQGRVLYIEQERARNLVYQASQVERGRGCDLGEILVIRPAGVNLRDPQWQASIRAVIEEQTPSLVVINSFRSVFRGRAADSSDIHEALGWLGVLAENACATIIIIDQQNKPGALGLTRGMQAHADSAQKEYECDAVLHIERDRDAVGRGTGPARVYVGKFRSAGESGPPFTFEVKDQPTGGVRVEYIGTTTLEHGARQAETAREKVFAALPLMSTVTTAQIVASTGLNDGTVSNELSALKRDGAAENPVRGQWRRRSSANSEEIEIEEDDHHQVIPLSMFRPSEGRPFAEAKPSKPSRPCPICDHADCWVLSGDGEWICGTFAGGTS